MDLPELVEYTGELVPLTPFGRPSVRQTAAAAAIRRYVIYHTSGDSTLVLRLPEPGSALLTDKEFLPLIIDRKVDQAAADARPMLARFWRAALQYLGWIGLAAAYTDEAGEIVCVETRTYDGEEGPELIARN